MKGPKFVISQQCEGGDWYVQSSPNINFTQELETAKELSQAEALEALDVLMTMQRTSSGSDSAAFTVKCVKKN